MVKIEITEVMVIEEIVIEVMEVIEIMVEAMVVTETMVEVMEEEETIKVMVETVETMIEIIEVPVEIITIMIEDKKEKIIVNYLLQICHLILLKEIQKIYLKKIILTQMIYIQ